MKKLLLPLISILTLAYPVIVFFGIEHLSPAVFGFLILILGVIRFVFSGDRSGPVSVFILLMVAAYSLLLAVSGSQWLLRLYPAVVSFGVAGVFAFSLLGEVSIIETMAAAAGKTITANAKRYTRRLTMVWAAMLVVNGLIALYLAVFASLAIWALYCGLLSYLIMGSFFILEYFYRLYYIKRVGE